MRRCEWKNVPWRDKLCQVKACSHTCHVSKSSSQANPTLVLLSSEFYIDPLSTWKSASPKPTLRLTTYLDLMFSVEIIWKLKHIRSTSVDDKYVWQAILPCKHIFRQMSWVFCLLPGIWVYPWATRTCWLRCWIKTIEDIYPIISHETSSFRGLMVAYALAVGRSWWHLYDEDRRDGSRTFWLGQSQCRQEI